MKRVLPASGTVLFELQFRRSIFLILV
jgi:hypothetical protein